MVSEVRSPIVKEGEVSVEAATAATPELVDAIALLLPHLSRARPPDRAALEKLVDSEATTLLVSRLGGEIVGMLSLAEFDVPTGRRGWIEDVVVFPELRGRGIATALIRDAIERARRSGCRTLDLTSRPVREEANRLYLRVGFELRETNVYRIAF
jgi:ribosomal protein S18 acetylase RimI-like enzyme